MITRRELVAGVGSLSAAYLLKGCGCHGSTPPVVPPPTEKFLVLFEGPWIFDAADSDRVRATTLGAFTGAWEHQCLVGRWNIAAPNDGELVGFEGSADYLEMPSGRTWSLGLGSGTSVTAPERASRSSLARPSACHDLFDNAFNDTSFVWLQKTALSVNPKFDDRIVTFPMPSKVHFTGRLCHATLNSPGAVTPPRPSSGSTGAAVQPFVCTIFEYEMGPSGTLSLHKTEDWKASEGITLSTCHLIFRMRHKPRKKEPGDDADQAIKSFNDLFGRVASSQKLELSGLKDTDYDATNHLKLMPKELGLGHGGLEWINASVYANCVGGGGVISGDV